MKCVRCEIIRAKLKAIFAWNLGGELHEIAEHLNMTEDGIYRVYHGAIRRIPPGTVGLWDESVIILRT